MQNWDELVYHRIFTTLAHPLHPTEEIGMKYLRIVEFTKTKLVGKKDVYCHQSCIKFLSVILSTGNLKEITCFAFFLENKLNE